MKPAVSLVHDNGDNNDSVSFADDVMMGVLLLLFGCGGANSMLQRFAIDWRWHYHYC